MKAKAVLISSVCLLFLLALLLPQSDALAGFDRAEGRSVLPDDFCLSCHGVPGLTTTLPSGEELYRSVDPSIYKHSIHGQQGYACVQCHTDIDGYPHREIPAQTAREYTIIQNRACERCHPGPAEANKAGAHHTFMEAGILEAAVCTDCHGAHNVDSLTPPRSNIPQTCERCHSKIYEVYKESAHGSALIGEGDPDVPSCIDCHGLHKITGPTSSNAFHMFSPQICAECHANEELMEKHGISTAVFETYIADFHGTTVEVFTKITPDQETNKPVCIDCHGVHNMKQHSDPESQVMKDNLLNTCQRCHPDATENFPNSWIGHYEPSLDKYPALFFVDLFYKVIIPVTVGGMLVFVTVDAQHRIRKKISKKASKEVAQ